MPAFAFGSCPSSSWFSSLSPHPFYSLAFPYPLPHTHHTISLHNHTGHRQSYPQELSGLATVDLISQRRSSTITRSYPHTAHVLPHSSTLHTTYYRTSCSHFRTQTRRVSLPLHRSFLPLPLSPPRRPLPLFVFPTPLLLSICLRITACSSLYQALCRPLSPCLSLSHPLLLSSLQTLLSPCFKALILSCMAIHTKVLSTRFVCPTTRCH